MTGAMYAAIAGLKTHMQKLSVIGNNIANVNTAGYKSQRTIFKDAMYTMYSAGSDGTTTTGGKNPSQIGYGSQISSIDLNMATGSFAPGTGLDCMIYGDGFFLVGDKDVANVIDPTNPDSLKSLTMTRVGDFSFKADGYLTDGSGSVVYGFLSTGMDANGQPIMSDQLVPIRLPKMESAYVYYEITTDPATGDVTRTKIEEDVYNQNVNTNTDPNKQYVEELSYIIKYPVDRMTTGTGVDATTTYMPLEDADANAAEKLPYAQLDSVSIDAKTGAITGTTKDTEELVTIGYLALGNVTNPNGVTHESGFYYKAAEGAGDLQVSLLGGVANDLGIGAVNGSLLRHTVEQKLANGTLRDADGNPVTDATAAEAIITAGVSDRMKISSAGGTNLMTGGLEGSNVDLATEISEMITTQRGYQANTRVITVTDSMLEELVNMKR